MAQTREKVLTYLHADWLVNCPKGTTLETCLSEAYRKLGTVAERTIIRPSGQEIRLVKKLEPRDGGFFAHITADTPGETASVVPKIKAGVQEADVATAAAPPDAEFMDGDAFLYVNDDHVCVCLTGLRDGAIRQFLYELFEKAQLGEHATKFDLLKAANVNKLKMLRAEGVKEIQLRASLYQASLQYEQRKENTSGVLRKIAQHIRSIVEAEVEDYDDSIRVIVTIKTDGRITKHLTVGEKRIEKLATDVVQHEQAHDDYVIVTNTGQEVRPDEIVVREVVQIDALGKSVKVTKAWDYLADFYKRLKRQGALGD
jgi:hypothetical protein